MNVLSLAAGVLPECQPEEVAEAGARAGYQHVGFTIEPDGWTDTRTRTLVARLRELGLKVLDVEVIWIPEDGQLTEQDRLIVEVGAELGANNVLTVSRSDDVNLNAAALRQLCEWAEPAGMRVCLEFLMIAAVRSFDQARAIVEACDHPTAGILIDPIHLQRAGEGPEVFATANPNWFPYAQFCDGKLNCDDNFDAYLVDALDLRSAAGEGELPLRQVLASLPELCPLSLEVRSKRYRDEYPDAAARARAIREQTERFLSGMGD